MKGAHTLKIGALALFLSMVLDGGANRMLDDAGAMAREQTLSACYCITQDCVGCGLCIDAYPECFCWNASETKAVFCIPNDCGDPVSLTKLCDVDSRVEEAAAGCYAEAIQPCN